MLARDPFFFFFLGGRKYGGSLFSYVYLPVIQIRAQFSEVGAASRCHVPHQDEMGLEHLVCQRLVMRTHAFPYVMENVFDGDRTYGGKKKISTDTQCEGI